jgi:hypothetical protein
MENDMTPSLSRTSLVSRARDLLEANVGDEVVLLNIDQGSYHALDAIAVAVWQKLKDPITVEALCADLVATFDVDEQQCEQDVFAFLNELREQRLLVIGDSTVS